MKWKECIDKAKDDFQTELQECIAKKCNPLCHAANWRHLQDRMVQYITGLAGSLEDKSDQQIQAEIHNMFINMKPVVKQWLEYYKKHNEDGCYDSWLERFWIEEKPDKETEQRYYMARMYEKFVQKGIIEIYYYSDSSDEKRQMFLNKWSQQYNRPYAEEEDEYLYIGQKGMPGDFYYGYADFYEPVDNPRESAWWNLISHALETVKI
ncbi:MAG: hypothetical protein HFJ06_01660 [Lachnospiraceae bacterium]|nr:hypothetical protein [Lachnospiraceae bacterium]